MPPWNNWFLRAIMSATITTTTTNTIHTARSLPTATVVSKIFPEAKHFVSKKHVRFDFSSSHPPIVRVDPGDLVHVETIDCFFGKIQPNSLSSWEARQKKENGKGGRSDSETSQDNDEVIGGGTYINGSILDEVPRSMRNPVTGPIYVNGARPGDVLAVKLLDIRPKGIGVACCGSWGGQLSCWMDEDSATLRFFDLSRCGTTVTMRDCQNKNNNEDENYEQEAPVSLRGRMLPIQKLQRRLGPIAFPTRPMLGVVGVAPCQQDDPIGTIPAGKHGGNLDNRNNGIGSTIYLPIHHPGGLLSMGDMHASQGDGEISGSGIEIGGDVLLSCEVLKHEDLYDVRLCVDGDAGATNDSGISLKLEYPVTETSTHWVTHGVLECDIPETTSIACQEAAKILIGQWGFTKEEAFVFLSVRGDLGLCQACHPDRGTQIAKMSVPKLEGVCPRAFRVLLDSAEENDAPRKRGLRPKDDASAG